MRKGFYVGFLKVCFIDVKGRFAAKCSNSISSRSKIYSRNPIAHNVAYEGELGFERTSGWQVYAGDGRRKYLDSVERAAFLAAAARESREVGVFCQFLIYCGCRVSEALGVQREHIDESGDAVVLRTLKRRKLVFRRVPLPSELIEALIAIAPRTGNVWGVHRATAWRWVTRVMETAGIEGPMACCRGARHGYAMHAAIKKVPPNLLQKWMGHASITTTAIYLEAVGLEERQFAERMWH